MVMGKVHVNQRKTFPATELRLTLDGYESTWFKKMHKKTRRVRRRRSYGTGKNRGYRKVWVTETYYVEKIHSGGVNII